MGAVESILTLLALRDGVVPATRNLKNLDPEIHLDVVGAAPDPATISMRSTTRSASAATMWRWCSVAPDQALIRVNCPSSLMPRLKKSLQPTRYFMYRW